AIADVVLGADRGADDFSGAIFAIKAARLHAVADRRVESAAALLRDHQSESQRFVEDRAGRYRHAGLGRELHQLATRVKPGAARFDLVKPSEGPLDCWIDAAFLCAYYVDSDERAHHRLGSDFTRHLALLRASTTAP